MRIPVIGQGVGAGVEKNVTVRAARNMLYEARPTGEKSAVIARATPNPVENEFAPTSGEKARRVFRAPYAGQPFFVTDKGLYDHLSNKVITFDSDADDAVLAGNNSYVCVTNMDDLHWLDLSDLSNDKVSTFDDCCGVGYLAGYFVAVTSFTARLYYSADAENWPALDFATVESSADSLRGMRVHLGTIVLFGDQTIEFWQPTGDANNPFAPIIGAASGYGTLSASSIAEAGDRLFFIGNDTTGRPGVFILNGYEPTRVTSPDIERLMHQGEISNVRMSGFYLLGKPYLSVRFTSGFTYHYWYDLTLGTWHEITNESGLFDICHFAELRQDLIGCDINDNKFYSIDEDAAEALGSRELVLDHVVSDDMDRFTIDSVRMDATGFDYSLMSVSRDGGETWGSTMRADVDPPKQMRWNRLGTARQFTLKFSFTGGTAPVVNNIFVNASN